MRIRQATAEDIPGIQRLYRQLDEYHVRLLPQTFHTVDGDASGCDVDVLLAVRAALPNAECRFLREFPACGSPGKL